MAGLHCFAVVIPGLEQVAEAELRGLSVHDIRRSDGGIEFTASLEGLARVNLRASCITRALVRLGGFTALSFPELYNKSRRIRWERYLLPGSNLRVQASCHRSRLMHSGRVEKAVFDAINDRLGGSLNRDDSPTAGEQRVFVRLSNNDCLISLDSSGDRLDRRGYRLQPGLAPLRETLAAGILQWVGWEPDEALMIPMCGAGTLAIEAAMMACRLAPNLEHDFAMRQWPVFRDKSWQRVYQRALAMRRSWDGVIHASDVRAAIIDQAKRNADRAGVVPSIDFAVADFFSLQSPSGQTPGLMVLNPPYGERIAVDAGSLYSRIGRHLRRHFTGWRVAIIVPDRRCEQSLGLHASQRLRVRHGGRWIQVLSCRL